MTDRHCPTLHCPSIDFSHTGPPFSPQITVSQEYSLFYSGRPQHPDPMAEALAVVGVVASIVQLVDFSSKVLVRLEEFQSSLGEIPKSFRHIKAELPVLRDTLQTVDAIDNGCIRDKTKTALIPAVEGCMEQIRSLDDILTKTLPTPNDSRLKRGTKAIWSLHQDAKVESITKVLRGFIGTLTFYYAAMSSTLQPLASK
jgi:hypothetical protein